MSIKANVRRAVKEDLNSLAELFNSYRVFYDQPSDLSLAKAFIQQRLLLSDSTIFVVESQHDGVTVLAGFTQLYPTFSSISAQSSLILNDLFVASAYRRKGVARMLMNAAIEHAKAVKSKGLALSTAENNRAAKGLYYSVGFVLDDDFEHYFLDCSKV